MHPRHLIPLVLAITASSLAAVPKSATEITQVSWPTLSPDGETVAFSWLDDLWIAPSAGGEATRITDDPARDYQPVFSPDGNRIVFTRETNRQIHVYSISVGGGEALRHTYHSEGSALECVSADSSRAIVRGLRERAGSRRMRLMEIDLTNERRERLLFDADGHSAAISPDGRRVLFCREGDQLFRKGYQGSRASQLWLFDRINRSFEHLLPDGSDLRSPRWHPDGGGYFYVSDRNGTPNLYTTRFDSPDSKPLTFFTDDGVILRDVSADASTFLLRRSWHVLRFRPAQDAEPQIIEFWTRDKLRDVSKKVERITGTNHADFTPTLDRAVFTAAGDIWSISPADNKPTRLTHTSEAESGLRFSPDGNWLYFLRDDGLEANYFRASWSDSSIAEEKAVTRGTVSKSRLTISPDGSRLAWVEGTGDVFTSLPDGSEARKLFECWDPPTLSWSPDGRFLALAARDRYANRDIWIADVTGALEPVNLTRDPAFEGSPAWSPDGRSLAFIARRNVARHTELWCIDFGKSGPAIKPSKAYFHAAGEQARRIDTGRIEPTRVVWSADSQSLLFQNEIEDDSRLLRVAAEGGDVGTVFHQRGVPIRMHESGALLWRIDRQPAVLMDGKLTQFPFSMRVSRPREEVLQLGFRRIWRTLGERFYDPTLNGKDWPALLEKYGPPATAARDSRQFDRVVGQLLGELNASHLTFQSRPWPNRTDDAKPEPLTAHPGLVFEDSSASGSLVIREVIPGSPAAQLADPPQVGEIVVSIEGNAVDDGSPLHQFFNGAEGKLLEFVFRSVGGTERTARIECISYARVRALRRSAELAAARAQAGETIAYLALERMNWADFAELEKEVFRASQDKSGLVLDLRANVGGQVADHLLALFSQPIHAFTIPRDGPRGYPQDRRTRVAWDGPLVVLCDQNTFSNAEIFCHAIKQTGRAPLVGVATAGGVISAVKVSIPDAGVLQVPFRGWFHAITGEDLDLNGAQPDYPIWRSPADEATGYDPQLAKALEVLAEQIEKEPAPIPPKWRASH